MVELHMQVKFFRLLVRLFTHTLTHLLIHLLTHSGGISDSFKSKFSDEIRVIENKDVLSSLNLQNIAALSPSIEVNAYKYQVEINKNNTDNTTISNSRVTSGGTAGSGSDNGSNDMDSLSSAGITNNVGWKAYEDNSQTKADPSGSRKKPSVGVIDPPNNEKPPKYTDRDSDDNVIEDTRNYVDYGIFFAPHYSSLTYLLTYILTHSLTHSFAHLPIPLQVILNLGLLMTSRT